MAMISPYQAFPFTKNTVQGTLSDEPLTNRQRILHADADLTVTLNFSDGASISINIAQGMDITLDGSAVTVSTTASAVLS